MDEITKAIRAAQVSAVMLRDGLHKAKPAEPVDDESQVSDKTAAKQATRTAAKASLAVPGDQATAAEHQGARDAHKTAADAHSKAAKSSTKPEDIVMHTATAAYHRSAADEHDQAATAAPAAQPPAGAPAAKE
jgi:hypothetical protein